jgi:hypothetical protein
MYIAFLKNNDIFVDMAFSERSEKNIIFLTLADTTHTAKCNANLCFL